MRELCDQSQVNHRDGSLIENIYIEEEYDIRKEITNMKEFNITVV